MRATARKLFSELAIVVQLHLDRVAFIRKRLSEVMEGTADASIFEAKLKKFWWTQRPETKEARQDELPQFNRF